MKNTKNPSRIKQKFNKWESTAETKLKTSGSHDENSAFTQSLPYQLHFIWSFWVYFYKIPCNNIYLPCSLWLTAKDPSPQWSQRWEETSSEYMRAWEAFTLKILICWQWRGMLGMPEEVWAGGLGRKGETEVIPERPWMEGNILKMPQWV